MKNSLVNLSVMTFLAFSLNAAAGLPAPGSGSEPSAQQSTAQPTTAGLSDAQLAQLGQMFTSVMSKVKNSDGTTTLKRPVFGKDHGCLKAEFTVTPNLPANLKVGVFAAKSYPAWIRFSNDGASVNSDGTPTPDTQMDGKNLSNPERGMAIKLVGVPGGKILQGEENELTQDFILENYPTFFSRNATDFLNFNVAAFAGADKFNDFLKAHPETSTIMAAMGQSVMADPLDGQFWTPTPYALGHQAMKYMVKPCTPPPAPETKPMTDNNYLRLNLAKHIAESDACFSFWVQVQSDAVKSPIDDATIEWQEPFVQIATLTIAKGQNIDAPERKQLCEDLSFTGWHALPEHKPLGSLNAARGYVYKMSYDARKAAYTTAHPGQPSLAEPTEISAGE